jgi:transposase
MKAYSIDFREKIVKAYEQGNTSVRKVASRFDVSKSFVQKLLEMKKTQGDVQPRQQGGAMKGELNGYEAQLQAMVEKYPDATLTEYCEYFGETYGKWVSNSTMCRSLKKQQLTLKKNIPQ